MENWRDEHLLDDYDRASEAAERVRVREDKVRKAYEAVRDAERYLRHVSDEDVKLVHAEFCKLSLMMTGLLAEISEEVMDAEGYAYALGRQIENLEAQRQMEVENG